MIMVFLFVHYFSLSKINICMMLGVSQLYNNYNTILVFTIKKDNFGDFYALFQAAPPPLRLN